MGRSLFDRLDDNHYGEFKRRLRAFALHRSGTEEAAADFYYSTWKGLEMCEDQEGAAVPKIRQKMAVEMLTVLMDEGGWREAD